MINQTIALDWLQASCIGKIETSDDWDNLKVKDNVVLRNCKHGTKHFQNKCELILDGEPYADIEYNPRAAEIIGKDRLIFRFKNNALYSAGFAQAFIDICDLMGWQFEHLSKMDIANDRKEQGFIKSLQGVVTGKVHVVGRADINVLLNRNNDQRPIKYMRVGQSRCDKFVRCYYKREEAAKTRKYHIESFWKLNGMELEEGQEVERVEVAMKKKEIDRYWQPKTIEDLKLLEKPEFLASLFEAAIQKFFEFVKTNDYKKHKGKITRCKKIMVLCLKEFGGKLLEKARIAMANEVSRFKQAAKTLFFVSRQTGKEIYHQLAEEMAANVDMFKWFYEKTEEWEYQFDLYKRKKRFKYLPIYSQKYSLKGIANDIQMNIGDIQFNSIKQLLKSI